MAWCPSDDKPLLEWMQVKLSNTRPKWVKVTRATPRSLHHVMSLIILQPVQPRRMKMIIGEPHVVKVHFSGIVFCIIPGCLRKPSNGPLCHFEPGVFHCEANFHHFLESRIIPWDATDKICGYCWPRVRNMFPFLTQIGHLKGLEFVYMSYDTLSAFVWWQKEGIIGSNLVMQT